MKYFSTSKKKRNPAICNNVNGPGRPYANGNKPERGGKKLHYFT